jgi:Uma2 family endonuclease
MAMPVTLRRFTVDELDAFPDDGNRYELLDGVLFVTPSPGLPHQMVATNLAAILRVFLLDEAGVFVAAPGVIQIRPNLRMEPDVLVGRLPLSGARWEDVPEHWLAVEVSGPASRVLDRDYKRDSYLQVGVLEVWRVDLATETIVVSKAGVENDRPHGIELTWRSPASGRELRVDIPALFRDVPHSRD